MFIRSTATVGDNANTALALNTYAIVASVFNSVNSSIQINNGVVTSGDAGATNAAGFTLGANGNASVFSNIQAEECIVFPTAHDAATRAAVISYLATVGGLSV